MSKRFLGQSGDVTRYFGAEDGKHYRGVTQDLTPVIQRVHDFKEKESMGSKMTNQNGFHYVGSVPMVVIQDWLNHHGYTFHDFAVNAGGEKGATNPRGSGVKDKFMRYFLSRDFAKLHTQHTTGKRERSSIVVPNYVGSKR